MNRNVSGAIMVLGLAALVACDQPITEPEADLSAAFGRPGPPPGKGPPTGKGPSCDKGAGFVVDGTLSVGEQLGSMVIPFTETSEGGSIVTGAFYLCNSTEDLYVAVEVDHELGVLSQEFFLLHVSISRCEPSASNCQRQDVDSFATRWWNGTIQQFDQWAVYEPCCEGGLDTDYGGTDDLVQQLATGSGRTVIEMSKPLDSGDTRDFVLQRGTVEELMQVLLQFNFPGDGTHYTANTGHFAYTVR